jgi:hypothetical protein
MASSTTFVAVYRGATIGEAHLLAVSTDPDLVGDVVRRLLSVDRQDFADPAVMALEDGRRDALEASMPKAGGASNSQVPPTAAK